MATNRLTGLRGSQGSYTTTKNYEAFELDIQIVLKKLNAFGHFIFKKLNLIPPYYSHLQSLRPSRHTRSMVVPQRHVNCSCFH